MVIKIKIFICNYIEPYKFIGGEKEGVLRVSAQTFQDAIETFYTYCRENKLDYKLESIKETNEELLELIKE